MANLGWDFEGENALGLEGLINIPFQLKYILRLNISIVPSYEDLNVA